MKSRVFKNNNVRIRREPTHDGEPPRGLPELLEAMQNDIDAPDVLGAEDCWPGCLVTLFVNGAPRRYLMGDGDAGRFRDGLTVSLAYLDDAPLFALPAAYRSEPFEHGGRRGTVHLLCEDPGEAAWADMLAAGCSRLETRTQYAPEIRRPAIFVPAGTPFDYA